MAPAHPTAGHSPLSRSKRSLDLARPEVLAAVGADQIAYYRARSPWYDDLYECKGDYDGGPDQNAEWRSDLASVENALAAVPLHGACVELGAGTGYWSEQIVDRVEELWALDASSEVPEIARSRLNAHAGKTHFQVVDLWRWEPTQAWDAAVACFFLEHVPDEVLSSLLATLHDALQPGAPFFVAEAAASASEPPEIETRSIDGRAYDVVERRRSPLEFEAALEAAGFTVVDVATERLVHLTAIRN